MHNFSDFTSQSAVVCMRSRYARLSQTRDNKGGTITLPIRIEKGEIPFFTAGCSVEAIQWDVEEIRYADWHTERERGDAVNAIIASDRWFDGENKRRH